MAFRRIGIFALFFCWGLVLSAEERDSIQVERWLKEASCLPEDSCRTLYFARQMLGASYVGGTLDQSDSETLVVSLDEVDCTTFVETVLALAVADKQNQRSYRDFKEALQFIRYRNGKLDGYPSRLHYFSDWIKDNEQKGIVKECTANSECSTPMMLHLDFMSTHSDSYLPMKKDSSLIQRIAEQEKNWQGVSVSYIPKEHLSASPEVLKIKHGDVLAITTSIKGLDVVHVGFAYWKGETLHLLHASSVAKKVIMDSQPLYEYSKNKKAHTGVRAISFVFTDSSLRSE